MYVVYQSRHNWSDQSRYDVDKWVRAWFAAWAQSKLLEIISSPVKILPYRKYLITVWWPNFTGICDDPIITINWCSFVNLFIFGSHSFWAICQQDYYFTTHTVDIGSHLYQSESNAYLPCFPSFFSYHLPSTGKPMEKFGWHELIL